MLCKIAKYAIPIIEYIQLKYLIKHAKFVMYCYFFFLYIAELHDKCFVGIYI